MQVGGGRFEKTVIKNAFKGAGWQEEINVALKVIHE